MKVRILSGNARGQIVEMSQIEAEVNTATGYAEVVDEAAENAEAEAEEKASHKERADEAADNAAEERAENHAAAAHLKRRR